MSELTAYQIRWANQCGAKYTKAEHTAAEGFGVVHVVLWNYYLVDVDQYTKAEHTAAPGFDAFAARAWNNYFPDREQYTRWEILKLKLKEFWEKLV